MITKTAPETPREDALTDLELNLLLEAILRASGHDFRDYAPSTLKRRVTERVRAEGVRTISGLQERVLHDAGAMERFALGMSGGSGRLFGDPEFFRAFRSRVVPLLRTYSFNRIWVPHCARGEDAYALAVVLAEEGLIERSMIYATDLSELGVAAAKGGTFTIESEQVVRAAHRATGATVPLDEFCTLEGNTLRFGETIKRNLIIARHSLVSDGSLNEFHVILARGILTQFNKALQFHVHNLFLASLVRLGFLWLGPNETLKQTPHERVFRPMEEGVPIYRRMR